MEFVLQGTYKNHLKSHEKSKIQQQQIQQQTVKPEMQTILPITQTYTAIPIAVTWTENTIVKPEYIEKKEN
jgi:hypothetical protein